MGARLVGQTAAALGSADEHVIAIAMCTFTARANYVDSGAELPQYGTGARCERAQSSRRRAKKVGSSAIDPGKGTGMLKNGPAWRRRRRAGAKSGARDAGRRLPRDRLARLCMRPAQRRVRSSRDSAVMGAACFVQVVSAPACGPRATSRHLAPGALATCIWRDRGARSARLRRWRRCRAISRRSCPRSPAHPAHRRQLAGAPWRAGTAAPLEVR